MADFAVGMAKSVVDGTLIKVQAAMEEEGRLRRRAEHNLVFITSELDMMKSFLEDADSQRLENAVVKTWVKQISDLAYDVEDCIEFVVHLDMRNHWWFRMLKPMSFCLALAPLPLDVAVNQLERIKAEVEEVSSRNSRYSLISDSGSKPSAAAAQNDQQQPSSSSDAVAGAAFQAAFKTTQKGRQCNLTELLNKEDPDLRVISMWDTRPGGGEVLRMVSIAWNAYTNKETCQNFVCRAWVKLMHPFNLHEFVQSLTGQFYANKEEQATPLGVQDLIRKMRATGVGDSLEDFGELVMKNRYLVVLEDLSTMVDWDAIRRFFPDMKNGSRIILSTQNFEVASLAVGHPCRVSHLGELSANHSPCALFTKVSEYDSYNSTEANNAHASKNGVPVITSKEEEAKKWIDENRLVGRESEMKDLGGTVIYARAKGYQVVSVWGIPGIGKSALVKEIFCDQIIKGRLFQRYSWVDVSNPFNLWEFSLALLSSLRSPYLEGRDPAGLQLIGSTDTIVECRNVLEKYACLVVIDGLQSTDDWDLINYNLVFGSNKHTVVIVITTEPEIATHCRGDKGLELVFNVKGLDADTAFKLFTKVAKKGETIDVKEYTSICGGIPRLIFEIACSFGENTIGRKHGGFDILRGLLGSTAWIWYSHRMDSYLRKFLRKFPDSLKPCILYLPIFPRNYFIRRRRLIRRWIAEGYSRDSHEASAEMTGEQLFSNLLDLNIIQQPTTFGLVDTRIAFCQVNGFFREYIRSRHREENLVFELSGRCELTTKRTGRHLVIPENWDRDRTVFESIDFCRLRSLTVFGNWKSFFISESMQLLRVLDLEGALQVECGDLKILKLISRLKFLSVRGCNEICHLPSSVGNMRQLQTLDVRHTSIVSLPLNITKLENLQYIRAGTTSPKNIAPTPHNLVSQLSIYCSGRHRVGVEMPRVGVKVPPGIRKLTLLHTLGVVNVSASGTKAVLEDLKKLTHLRKLGVSGINNTNSYRFFFAIKVLVRLESLSVRLESNNERCLDGIPLSVESLRSLKLYGLGDRLPNWKEQLTMLTKMDLEITKLTEDYISPSSEGVSVTPPGRREPTAGVIKFLSELPGLCILRLRVHHLQDNQLDVSVIMSGLEDFSFQKMKIFEVSCSLSSKVTFGKKTMKHLEQLKVDCGSGSQLFGMKHLSELKEVLLKGPSGSDQALIDDLKEELKNHPMPRKPVVKLEELPSSS